MKTLHDFDGNIIGYLDDVNMQITMLQDKYNVRIQEEKQLKAMMKETNFVKFGTWNLELVPSEDVIEGRKFYDEGSLTLILSNDDVDLIKYMFCDESNGWIDVEEIDKNKNSEKRTVSTVSSIKPRWGEFE